LQESPYFALHIRIAIGFLKAIGFRNKPKRTILDFWSGDPISKELLTMTTADAQKIYEESARGADTKEFSLLLHPEPH
jgi:hypothetical protein